MRRLASLGLLAVSMLAGCAVSASAELRSPSASVAYGENETANERGRRMGTAIVEAAVGHDGCVGALTVTTMDIPPAARDRLLAAARAIDRSGGWIRPGGPWIAGQFWVGDRASAIDAWDAREIAGDWVVSEVAGGPFAFQLLRTDLDEFTLWSRGDRVEPCPPGSE